MAVGVAVGVAVGGGVLVGVRVLVGVAVGHFAEGFGPSLRIAKVQELTMAPYTMLGWTVPDITATATSLAARGVPFQRYDGLEQDALGIWTSPDGARVAWFKDPDGNTLSLTQFLAEHDSGPSPP